MREVVDVLGRAREMDEFGDARDLFDAREPFPQPVFDGLDVVVGRALDRLDALGVGGGERRRTLHRARRAHLRRTARTSAIAGSSESATSHAISMRTRARISPNSLKCSASGATFVA